MLHVKVCPTVAEVTLAVFVIPVISGHITMAFTQFDKTSVFPVLPISAWFDIRPHDVALPHQVKEPEVLDAEAMLQFT